MESKLRRGLVPSVLSGLSGWPREEAAEAPARSIPITEVELFDILADNRRRSVIRQLAEPRERRGRPSGALATAVASAELHMPEDAVPAGRVDEVAAALDGTHLPRLAEAGIVRWDEPEDVVAPGPWLGPVAEWLGRIDRFVEPTTQRHRGCRNEREPRPDRSGPIDQK